MSTFMAKAETVERKWYVLDAGGQAPRSVLPLLLLCSLRGKQKATFTPHVDCGDFVIIINADKAVRTGKETAAEVLSSSHRLGW